MATGDTTRLSQDGASGATGAVHSLLAGDSSLLPASLSRVRFPGEDGGRSLADMAHRDLDAALQLLAFRAQYITEASGAAIAIRRREHNDMLCRASAGSNAPELGALLSTESGLSGESVRTRMPLQCDDTERDPRVNRDGCRELGIASVAVMPILSSSDDRVLGVFELFSGKARAFGQRDLSALQRLAEMVETAVQLDEAAQSVVPPAEIVLTEDESADDDILCVVDTEVVGESVAPVIGAQVTRVAEMVASVVAPSPFSPGESSPSPIAAEVASTAAAPAQEAPLSSAPAARAKKPLLWSVALQPSVETPKVAQADLSHVPPVLRGLRKCWACGFPVSEGRKLCVECEEKQWRGQLRAPAPAVTGKVAVSWTGEDSARAIPSSSVEASAPAKATRLNSEVSQSSSLAPSEISSAAAPTFSAGIGSSESWLSSNRYIVVAILVVVIVVAAIVFLR